jgi:hypothetical protein
MAARAPQTIGATAAQVRRSLEAADEQEALRCVQELYPHQPIPPKSQYLLEELFPADDASK